MMGLRMTKLEEMKHKHCDLIVAWANGAEIEYQGSGVCWHLSHTPTWDVDAKYRIKPSKTWEEVHLEYTNARKAYIDADTKAAELLVVMKDACDALEAREKK